MNEPLLRNATSTCFVRGSSGSRSHVYASYASAFKLEASSLASHELHSEVFPHDFVESLHGASDIGFHGRQNKMTAQRDFLYLADDGSLPAPSTQPLAYSDFAGASTHILRVSWALQNMSRDDSVRHHRLDRQCLSPASVREGAGGVDSGDKPSLTSIDRARIACQTPLPLISSDTSDSGSIIKMLSDEIRSVVDREARLRSDPVPIAEQTVCNQQVPTLPQQAAAGVSKCPGPPPLEPLPPLPRPQDVLERPQAKKQSTASTRSSMPYHMASQVGTRLFHDFRWRGPD